MNGREGGKKRELKMKRFDGGERIDDEKKRKQNGW